MPYLELSVRCREAEQPRYENALDEVGALAVTLLDAEAETANEQAILEPGVGETPLWGNLVLTALFPHDANPLALLAELESSDAQLDWGSASFRAVEDQDWERAWLDQFKPLRFGARTFIVPWNHELPDAAKVANAAVVRLDPGLAFGSGTHPTTALCLRWLDELAQHGELQGKTVLDFGCGSGILALAALKLGASHAVGVDNDPQALIASRDNADRNEVGDKLDVHLPQDEPQARYPVVVANILASALDALAETLAARVAPGGRIALSGILKGQEDELLQRYSAWFGDLRAIQDEDWMRIDGVRLAAEAAQGSGASASVPLPPTASPLTVHASSHTAPSFSRIVDHAAAKPRTAPWQWIALAALALILCLQMLLADRARLASDARWRPMLESVCGALHCELPAWREPQAFTMLSRSVSPGGDGTLLAQASFRNDARWAQPMPTLALSIADANGRVLGAREFAPGEYLDARNAAALLPPGQMAQVELRLREPPGGVEAYTYEFR